MSVTSKKNETRKKVRRARALKPMPEVKYIGLDEKNEEADRILKSLKNPEILRK